MRKISPNDVRDDFREQLRNLSDFHTEACTALTGQAQQSTLTENNLLAAAVAWEGFVSDMFIAYINRDATQFKQHVENSFTEHLRNSGTPERAFDKFGTMSFPAHLKKADVLALADNFGNNITFSNFKLLEEKAKSWLVEEHAEKFTRLTAQHKAVVNSVIALRNHIAHRSDRSLTAMNDTLAKGVLTPLRIKRLGNRFHNVGAWLKSVPIGSTETRFTILMTQLDQIAGTF